MIKRLIFVLIILLVWILVVEGDRYFALHPTSAMPSNVSNSNNNNSLSDSPAPTITIEDNKLQERIQSQLYSSISTGMTYEEVSSIIGWQGVLIYQTQVNLGGKAIETKVYQWNYNVYSHTVPTTNNFDRDRIIHPYQNLTLEFQDNVLVELPISMVEPY